MSSTVRLLINCPDARGIIAAVANFVAANGGNILDADQHTDPHTREFFMRIEIDPDGFALTRENFAESWRAVADKFAMRWWLHWSGRIKRMVVLASREDHCLHDLLWRWRTKELLVDLPLVISNHLDLRSTVESCGVRFEHVPNTLETRAAAEQRMNDLLSDAQADFVVLARYMQVLSPAFISTSTLSEAHADTSGAHLERGLPQPRDQDLVPPSLVRRLRATDEGARRGEVNPPSSPLGKGGGSRPIINIHHSFLPAFAGRRPYHQAFERGVKIIGATSHYVTNDLDAGPIIAQSTIPVDHRDTIEDMIRKGRDLERSVLARAVRLHIEDRILVSNNKTVVFE